jgi:hypothetical protein
MRKDQALYVCFRMTHFTRLVKSTTGKDNLQCLPFYKDDSLFLTLLRYSLTLHSIRDTCSPPSSPLVLHFSLPLIIHAVFNWYPLFCQPRFIRT